MKDKPDIIKELRGLEKLGKLQNKIQETYADLEKVEDLPEDALEETTGFLEDETKRINSDKDLQLDNDLSNLNTLFDLLFENTNDMVAVIDRFGKILRANPSVLQFSGFNEKEVIGKRLWTISGVVSKHDLPRIANVVKKVWSGKPVRNFSNEIKDKNGKKHSVELSFYPCIENIKSRLILLIGTDNTEQKKTLEELRKNEEKYRDLFESSNDLIQSVKPDGSLLYVNRAWKEQLGYKDKELSNLSIFDIIHPDSKDKCKEIFKKVLSGEHFENIETSFITKDGKRLNVEGNINCRIQDGKPVSTHGIFRNITERKQSEERISKILKSSPSGIMAVDTNGKITSWSPKCYDLFGWSEGEVIGKFNPTVPKTMKNIFLKTIREEHSNLELKVLKKDNSMVDISLSTAPLYDDDGSFIGALGVMTDISERKKIEDKYIESEGKYRLIVDNSEDVIMLTLPNAVVTYISPACKKVLGHDPSDIVGNVPDIFHPDDKIKGLQALSSALDGKSGSSLDYRIITKDKKTKWIGHSWSPIMKDKNLHMVVSVIRDITFQKKVEEKLRIAYENLETQVKELERYKRLTVGRELRMAELKKRVNELERKYD